jgi:hypothetical protein
VASSKIIQAILLGILVIGIQQSFASPSFTLTTSKQIYEYGDYLAINFQVSEITGDQILLQIIDSAGNSSSPIPIQISKTNTTIIAPIPFYKTTYNPGTYKIDAEYSGFKSSTSFKIIDSGRIAIPPQYKTLVTSSPNHILDTKDYAALIQELIHFDIIKGPNHNDQKTNPINIPSWLKGNAKLWADGSITDNEFGQSIQYLIQKGIVSV